MANVIMLSLEAHINPETESRLVVARVWLEGGEGEGMGSDG